MVVRLTGEPELGRPSVSTERFPGVGYMFWSMYQQEREAILPGERFQLRLHGRAFRMWPVEVQGHTLDVKDSLRYAAAAVWLLLRLGGAGARVRRAGGRLRPVGTPRGWPDSVPSPVSSAESPEQLAAELTRGLRQLREWLPWPLQAAKGFSEYDALHPDVCRIAVVGKTFGRWWEAVDWIGGRFQQFRRSQVNDAGAVAQLVTQGRMAAKSIQRAIFGLPIVFFFKSIFEALVGQGMSPREARREASATASPRRAQARASPLLIRVARLAGSSVRNHPIVRTPRRLGRHAPGAHRPIPGGLLAWDPTSASRADWHAPSAFLISGRACRRLSLCAGPVGAEFDHAWLC